MKKKPEGWLNAAIVLFGILILITISFLFLIQALAKEPELPEVSYPETVSFEEQLEADLDAKYEIWIEEQQKETGYLIDVDQRDIDLMARVVMSEASILGSDAKQAIAQTIVNRVRDTDHEFRYQNTVYDVVTAPNAYSLQDNGIPDELCYDAVYAALTYEAFPSDMFYFREGRYHDFGYEYCHIGSTYFTTAGEN